MTEQRTVKRPSRKLDYLFLFDDLDSAGPSQIQLNYLAATQRNSPRTRIGVTFANSVSKKGLGKIPEGVRVVRFGKLFQKTLKELRPSVLHLVDSKFGRKAVEACKGKFPGSPVIYLSAVFDWPHLEFFRRNLGSLTAVFLPIQSSTIHLRRSLKSPKFKTIYQPARLQFRSDEALAARARGNKILLRYSQSEYPNMWLVCSAIAKAAPEFEFHIHTREPLGTIWPRNVVVHSPDGSDRESPIDSYNALIWIDAWNGTSNVVFEAFAAGVPVLVPASEATRELVNEETGFVVSHFAAIREYVAYLSVIKSRPDTVGKKIRAAQELLRRRHSDLAFAEGLRVELLPNSPASTQRLPQRPVHDRVELKDEVAVHLAKAAPGACGSGQTMGITKTICRNRWNFPSINFAKREVRTCVRYAGDILSVRDLKKLGTDFVLNNPHQLRRRMDMIQGRSQVDCSGCYRLEESGAQSARGGYQDFVRYQATVQGTSESAIAEELYNVDENSRLLHSSKPTELEVSFGNKCNLKCVYCSYDASSQWAAELIAAGDLDRAHYERTFGGGENQDFHDLFWKWYHEVGRHSIRTIFIIGGEPLLGDRLERFMDRLIAEHSELRTPASGKPWINLISNLTLPPDYLDRLLGSLPRWFEHFRFDFNVSLESFGSRAEYIRSGMKWDRFDRNIDTLFGSHFGKDLQLSFLPTLCSTSVSSTPEFVDYYLEKRHKFDQQINLKRNVAMFPLWQCPLILTPDFSRYLTVAATRFDALAASDPHQHGWQDYRDYLIKMAAGIREQKPTGETRRGRISFARQVAVLDQRRSMDFRAVFPEYHKFLRMCEHLEFRSPASEKLVGTFRHE